jgi:hypothetical protein
MKREKCKNRGMSSYTLLQEILSDFIGFLGTCTGHQLPEPYNIRLPNCILPVKSTFKMHDNLTKKYNYRGQKTKRLYTIQEFGFTFPGSEKNKEQIREYQQDYWPKYYKQNKEQIKERMRIYRANKKNK